MEPDPWIPAYFIGVFIAICFGAALLAFLDGVT